MTPPIFLLRRGGVFFVSAPTTKLYTKKVAPCFLFFQIKKSLPHGIAFLISLTIFFTPISLHAQELRIVSCAPSLTEILCELGLGENLVGVTNLCDYPPETTSGIEKIGSIGSFSLEKIISLKPDIVFTLRTNDRAIKNLKKSSIKVIESDPQSIKEIKDTVKLFGEILGKKEKAHSIIEEMIKVTDEIKRNAESIRKGKNQRAPRIYIEIYYPPPWSASSKSFIGEIVELMGFENIFSRPFLNIASGGKNYFPVNLEEIIARKPEVALVLSGDIKFKSRRGFEYLPAVKNNRVIYPDGDRSVLVRATPRMLREAVKLQNKIFYTLEKGGKE